MQVLPQAMLIVLVLRYQVVFGLELSLQPQNSLLLFAESV